MVAEGITRDQFKILVKAMKAVYAKPDFIPDADAFNVWYMMLRDISYEVLTNAVQKHMMTSVYPPLPADLRSAAAQFSPGACDTEMSELEAWELVRKAICNSNYHSEEEFAKLPKLVQKAIGNPASLREWAAMDIATVNSVEQSHFIRAFRTAVSREKELVKLSPVMRNMIDKVASGAALDDARMDEKAIAEDPEIKEVDCKATPERIEQLMKEGGFR